MNRFDYVRASSRTGSRAGGRAGWGKFPGRRHQPRGPDEGGAPSAPATVVDINRLPLGTIRTLPGGGFAVGRAW